MKRKIVVTTGTRAEYGLLRSLLHEIEKSKKLELYLIVSGMHLSKKYGKTIDEIKKDGFKIYAKVEMIPKGNSNYDMSIALANGILQFSKIFKELKPNINVILGDRDEPFASAIAAFHMNIPNAHIHGGERSQGGLDEYIRHAITKISNIHFGVTKKSIERILKMGENPNYVFFTGSPGIDEVLSNKKTSKKELEKKYNLKLQGDEIILVQHPVTTQSNESEKEITNTLKAILKTKKETIAILPNSDAGNYAIIKKLKETTQKFKHFHTMSNVPREDYLGFLNHCGVLVGNSSSGIIEGNYFSIPVVNIGIRQKGREHGENVINTNNSSMKILKSIQKGLQWKKQKKKFKIKKIYGTGNSSQLIVKHLETIALSDNLIKKQITY